jgi:hypothetical protein
LVKTHNFLRMHGQQNIKKPYVISEEFSGLVEG